MSKPNSTHAEPLASDDLAKRVFALAMAGVLAYVAVVIALMSLAD